MYTMPSWMQATIARALIYTLSQSSLLRATSLSTWCAFAFYHRGRPSDFYPYNNDQHLISYTKGGTRLFAKMTNPVSPQEALMNKSEYTLPNFVMMLAAPT
jgi:hypothetical protein